MLTKSLHPYFRPVSFTMVMLIIMMALMPLLFLLSMLLLSLSSSFLASPGYAGRTLFVRFAALTKPLSVSADLGILFVSQRNHRVYSRCTTSRTEQAKSATSTSKALTLIKTTGPTRIRQFM